MAFWDSTVSSGHPQGCWVLLRHQPPGVQGCFHLVNFTQLDPFLDPPMPQGVLALGSLSHGRAAVSTTQRSLISYNEKDVTLECLIHVRINDVTLFSALDIANTRVFTVKGKRSGVCPLILVG